MKKDLIIASNYYKELTNNLINSALKQIKNKKSLLR